MRQGALELGLMDGRLSGTDPLDSRSVEVDAKGRNPRLAKVTAAQRPTYPKPTTATDGWRLDMTGLSN